MVSSDQETWPCHLKASAGLTRLFTAIDAQLAALDIECLSSLQIL